MDMDEYEYTWMHRPSGKKGKNRQRFLSETDFLRHLNQWNSQDPENYHYYAQHTLPVIDQKPEHPQCLTQHT